MCWNTLSTDPKEIHMTKNEFIEACVEHAVIPSVALENDAVQDALKRRDDEEVHRLLAEEF